MAALEPNNTNRLWLRYSDGVNEHELLVRFDDTTDKADLVMVELHNMFTALEPAIFALSIAGVRVSAEGGLLSFPMPWSGDPSYGTGAMPAKEAPRQACFLGRSSGGRRVRFFIFGADMTTPDLYRFNATGGWADALDVIVAAQTNGMFLAIDGLAPTMYNYIDVNYNSYWEQERRG